MISFTVDTGALSEEFTLTKKDVDAMMTYCVQEVAGSFASLWEDLARKNLRSSRNQYINSIVVSQEGPTQTSVALVGKLANMIETGVSPFDMKTGFEASAKKHMKKDGGWYMTIPFRFATPGAIGENEVFSGRLPQPVYAVVKSAPVTIPISGGMRSAGLDPLQIASPYDQVKTRAAVTNIPESKIFAAYEHKSSIYAGITKVQDSTTGQNRYMSFRRVSDKSDPMSWINSGIEAHNFGDKAEAQLDVPTVVDQAVDTFLSRLGF
jgi:hypothetical protein